MFLDGLCGFLGIVEGYEPKSEGGRERERDRERERENVCVCVKREDREERMVKVKVFNTKQGEES